MEHKKPHKKRDGFAFGISLGEFATSVVTGLVGGTLTAWRTTRNHFSEDLKNSHKYAAKFEQQAEDLANVTMEKCGSFENLVKEIVPLKAIHRDQRHQWATEYRGVRNSTIMGTIDRYRTFGSKTKTTIAFNAVLGVAVGAGAMLSFFNGVATRDKIELIEDAVNEKQNEAASR